MQRICVLVICLGACASSSGPRDLVERAIDAQGGADAMRAIRTVHIEAEGTSAGGSYRTVQHIRRPLEWRWDMTGDFGGLKMTMGMWMLGEQKTYQLNLGRTVETVGDAGRATATHAYASAATLLPEMILQPGVGIKAAANIDIDGLHHQSATVLFEGAEPFTLSFHPDTGRISRVSFRVFDDMDLKWVTFTGDMSGWQEIGDILVAHKMDMTMGPNRLSDEIQDIFFNRDPKASIFETPETTPLLEVDVKDIGESKVAYHVYVGHPGGAGAAAGKVMAWIQESGGQPRGGYSFLSPGPFDWTARSRNETVIHVPCEMKKAPRGGDITYRRRPAFKFAYVEYSGPIQACSQQYGTVWEWCRKNGFVQKGPRRITMISGPDEQGNVKAEVGFPVRKKKVYVLE